MRRLAQLGAAALIFAAWAVAADAADLALLHNGYEIRHQSREVIGDNTRLYLTADRTGGYIDVKSDQIAGFEKDESVRPAPPTPLSGDPRTADANQAKIAEVQAAVAAASKIHAMDPDLIASVIRAESSFNSKAVSPKGAQGLMQLMPGTASKLGVKDSFDADANVDGGTRYLRQLLLRYHDDLPKALAAYNAGPYRVDQYKGVPPYNETRKYVARIIRDFNRKKLANGSAAKPSANVNPGKHGAAKGESRKLAAGANATSYSAGS